MPRRSQPANPATAARVVVALVVVAGLSILGWLILTMFNMFSDDRDRGGELPLPDTVNLTQTEAVALLEGLGFKVKIQSGNNDESKPGTVFKQNPKPKMHRKPGSTVNIWVSQGKARYVVPALTGKHVDAASQELIAAGFKLGVLKKVYDPSLPPGQVVSQQPLAGQEYLSPPAIDLLLSDNAQTDIGPMPNLAGQPLADAERLLARSGLQLIKVTQVLDESAAPGSVLKQSIAADMPAKLGQKVELTVAIAPEDAHTKNKRLQVQIVIPEGAPQQQVRIKVSDALGESVQCDETKAPGDTVSRAVDIEGPAKIFIYIRDMKTPWRTDIIPYEAAPWTPPADDTAEPGGDANTPPPGATL